MAEAIRLHTEVTGEPPRGWYTGRTSIHTVDLACEAGVFDYVSDTYDDDLPYWREHDGRQQLIIPYSLEANDMRFSAGTLHDRRGLFHLPQGHLRRPLRRGRRRQPEDVLRRPALPPRRPAGPHRRRSRASSTTSQARPGLDRRPASTSPATGTRRHPAPAAGRAPDDAGRDAFVAAFGGIYEHSPWIAERAFELELGPAHDTAVGLAQRARPGLPLRVRGRSGSASSPPTPTSPASSPRRSG